MMENMDMKYKKIREIFQSNLRKQISRLPKILKSVKIIHYYSLLFIDPNSLLFIVIHYYSFVSLATGRAACSAAICATGCAASWRERTYLHLRAWYFSSASAPTNSRLEPDLPRVSWVADLKIWNDVFITNTWFSPYRLFSILELMDGVGGGDRSGWALKWYRLSWIFGKEHPVTTA